MNRISLALCTCLLVWSSAVPAQGLVRDARDAMTQKLNDSKLIQNLKNTINQDAKPRIERALDRISPPDDAPKTAADYLSEQNNTDGEVDDAQFNAFPSLFFQPWQRKNIYDVRRSQGPIYEAYLKELQELRRNEQMKEKLNLQEMHASERASIPKPPESERYIHLQGLLYSSPKIWVIYLNGQKITPQTVPSNIVDINVSQESVEVQWYDEYSNKVIPLRLRPMQRFHIDSRIFVPGNS